MPLTFRMTFASMVSLQFTMTLRHTLELSGVELVRHSSPAINCVLGEFRYSRVSVGFGALGQVISHCAFWLSYEITLVVTGIVWVVFICCKKPPLPPYFLKGVLVCMFVHIVIMSGCGTMVVVERVLMVEVVEETEVEEIEVEEMEVEMEVERVVEMCA